MKEPLSRILITVTVSVEVRPGVRVLLHEFTRPMPKLRLSAKERKDLDRYVPVVDSMLVDNGLVDGGA